MTFVSLKVILIITEPSSPQAADKSWSIWHRDVLDEGRVLVNFFFQGLKEST